MTRLRAAVLTALLAQVLAIAAQQQTQTAAGAISGTGLLHAAQIVALTAVMAGTFGLAPGHALEASAAQAQAAQKLAPPTFTLEVRRTAEETKGDIHVPAEWVTQLAIPARDTLRFRFGPAKQTAGGTVAVSAEWRVYLGPPPAFDFQGTAPSLRKRGAAGPIPQPGKVQEFDLDLQTVLPVKPSNKAYYVQVVGRDGQGKYTGGVSSAVVLKYETSSWGTTLPDVPIVASASEESKRLIVVLRSSINPPKTLGEIPPDLRIVLEPQKLTPASVWWTPASAPILRLKPSSISNTANLFGGKPGKRLEAWLPDVIAGGDYRLRVESSAIGYPSRWVAAKLAARVQEARYTVQYQGVRCVEETDGPGDDELAVYVAGGLNDISALPFQAYDPQWPRQLIARHANVDAGELHPAAVTLVDRNPLEFVTQAGSPKNPARPVTIWFDVLEIDGSVPKKGEPSDYQFIATRATLTITADDLRKVGQKQGWHKWSVNIKGDSTGGHYHLWFGLKADPAPK